jgi:Mg/Co/Ni transporter MgtE
MRSFGIRRVPVIDRNGVLQGVVTLDDVLEFLQEQVADMSNLLSRERQREVPRPP